MNIKDIHINPNNPRYIRDERYQKLKKSIQEFPKMMKLRPIIIDDTGMILGGNMRYLAMIDLGYKEIPEGWVVKASELTEEEKDKFKILDNVPFGNWDYEILANEWDLGELQDWGIEIPEMEEKNIEAEEDLFNIEKAIKKTAKPITKLRDIWQLGEHRLMCGSAIIDKDVESLMNNQMADMGFFDPPYLMGFTGNVHKDGSKSFNAGYDDIENDKLDDAEAGLFLAKIPLIIKRHIKGSYYICFYRLGIEKIINALKLNGLNYHSQIIWHKNNHNLSNSDYQNIYEPIIYGWNKEHNFYGTRSNFDFITAKRDRYGIPSITTQARAIYLKSNNNYYKFEVTKKKPKNYIDIESGKVVFNIFTGENNIWEIDKTKKNDLHPTMKPIELCGKAIKNSSKSGDIILDLYGGSGSTLIACEQLNRICYMMEIEPIYCDVIIKRWEQYTGKKAVKINGKE